MNNILVNYLEPGESVVARNESDSSDLDLAEPSINDDSDEDSPENGL